MLKENFIALMEKKAKAMLESLSDAELKVMYDRYFSNGVSFLWHTIAAEMGKRGLIPNTSDKFEVRKEGEPKWIRLKDQFCVHLFAISV